MTYIKTDGMLTIVLDGELYSISSDEDNFQKVYKAVIEDDEAFIRNYFEGTKLIILGTVKVKNGVPVTEDGKEIVSRNELSNFIKLLVRRGMISENADIEPIKPFLVKVLQNKFINCLTELYEFCSAGDFEITKEGNLIAYKRVNKDLTSCHDGVTQHAVGQYTEEKNFDTDRTRTCSNGLHFCSYSYLNFFGGETVIAVEVDPRDIVAIPEDYNFSKGRCRRYKTVAILEEKADEAIRLKKLREYDTIGDADLLRAEEEEDEEESDLLPEDDDCPRYLTGRYKTLYKYTKTDGLSEAQIRKKMGIKKSTYERYMRKMNEMIRNYGG